MRVGVVLLLVTAAASGQSLSSARVDLVEDLEALAKWCAGKHLVGSRNRVYEILLHYAPDHAKARKWLRYVKRDGEWVRVREYRAPRDRNTEALPEFERRLRELGARFKARVYPYARDEATSVAQRRAIYADILALSPDDKEVRDANGEVRVGKYWCLRESLTALERRDRLAAAATKALESVPAPRRDQIEAQETRLRLPWTGALQGRWWRFVGTTDLRETTYALKVADASAAFVAAALPDRSPDRSLAPVRLERLGAGMYYLDGADQGRQFVLEHRAFTPREKQFVLRLGGTWVPKTARAVNWMPTYETRLDAAARAAIQVLYRVRYGRPKAWVNEGFGLYLSWYLVGTRLTFYVQRTRYAQQTDWDKARQAGADWLAIARDMRRDGKAPDFRFLFGKNLNQLTLEDVIHAHSVAAYMIEGHPDRVSAFLAAYGEDGDVDKALADAYGLTLGDMEDRLVRWLDETK